jgi:adenosylhomocysteinase
MDMSFADQALATEWLVKNQASLEAKVYNIPSELDLGVAKLKLSTLGIMIDDLSERQNEYNNAWQEGT